MYTLGREENANSGDDMSFPANNAMEGAMALGRYGDGMAVMIEDPSRNGTTVFNMYVASNFESNLQIYLKVKIRA